jgi:uncharacterized protein (TIGR03437 family)
LFYNATMRAIAIIALATCAAPAQTGTVTIKATSSTIGIIGKALKIGFVASGGTPPYSWGTSGRLPPGISQDATGSINGVPTSPGQFSFSITVVDSAGNRGSLPMTLSVYSPLTIGPEVAPFGTVGQPYRFTMYVNGELHNWYLGGTLPPGLKFPCASDCYDYTASSVTIAGIPTQAGAFSFTALLHYVITGPATRVYEIKIQPALQILTTSLTARVGQPMSLSLAAQGGNPPYLWSLAGGVPPNGISLDSTGVLRGVPVANGSFTFSVNVKDSQGATATQSVKLLVDPAPLAIASSAPDAVLGQPYSAQLLATGGVPPYYWTLARDSTLPNGLTLSSDGKLSGMIASTGSFSFTITLTDATGQIVTGLFSVKCIDNPNPLIVNAGVVNASSGAQTDLVPGEWITIYGQRMSTDEQIAVKLPFPTTLAGAQVLVNGQPVPLWYASRTQINAIVPAELPVGSTASVEVTVSSDTGQVLRSNNLALPVAAASPGLALYGNETLTMTSHGAVTPTNPAQDGDEVTFYGTGFGSTQPFVATNQIAPSNPLSTTVLPVSVSFGGIQAIVRFAGLSPGSIGLIQINAKLGLPPRPVTGPTRLEGTLTVGDRSIPIFTWF